MKNLIEPITHEELYNDLVKTFIERKTMDGMDAVTARKKGNIYAVRNTRALFNMYSMDTKPRDEDSSEAFKRKNEVLIAGMKAYNELFERES